MKINFALGGVVIKEEKAIEFDDRHIFYYA